MFAGTASFFDTLGLFVVAAALTVLLARWLRLPSIVSFLLAGLLVGPVLGLVERAGPEQEAISLISEMGIVLLMFIVGLELSLTRVKEVGKVAVAAGLGQVVFTAAGGMALCLVLGFSVMESIFISTALTFSSTVVVVKLLDQKNELYSLYGRIAVGIFLVQDLVVIVVLTLLAGLERPEALEPAQIALSLAKAFSGMAVLLGACLLGGRYLLPRLFGWAASAPRLLFMWSLTWCLGFVFAAHALGLSAEIGAFLAGLAVAQLKFAGDLRRRVHPLMSFFLAVFFVSLGARMQLGDAGDLAMESLVLSLFVLLGNPLIFMVIIVRYGYSERTAFLASVTVAQISEFSFIFVAMGVKAGLIGPPIMSVVGVVGVVTITVSSYMILYNRRLYELLEGTAWLRMFRAKTEDDGEAPGEVLRGHVVVVGMNDFGRRVAVALHERGEQVLAIDTDAGKLSGLKCRTMVGDIDYASTLEEAFVPSARLAVSALRIENVNKLFAYRCGELGVPVAVYAFDRSVRQQLEDVKGAHLVESRVAAGRRLVEELERLGVSPS